MQYTLQHAYIVACSAGMLLAVLETETVGETVGKTVAETLAETILSLIIKLGKSSGSTLLTRSSRKPAGKPESELVSWSRSCKGPCTKASFGCRSSCSVSDRQSLKLMCAAEKSYAGES